MTSLIQQQLLPHRMDTRLSMQGCSVLVANGRPNALGITATELLALKRELTAIPLVNGRPPPPSPCGSKNGLQLWRMNEFGTRVYMPKQYGISKYGLPSQMRLALGSDLSLQFQGAIRPEQQLHQFKRI